jgi:hypothetical protein
VTGEDVASLVRDELQRIRDGTVREALASLITKPDLHLRDWDYGPAGQRFPCWTVVADPASDTALVFSAFGFGPSSPWGLVILSGSAFGMDSGWYSRLEDAFVESYMASPLLIWDLVSPDGHVLSSSISLDEAFAKRDALDAGLAKPRHHVLYRSRPLEGIP